MNWLILSWALTAAWLPLDDQGFLQQPIKSSQYIDSAGCFSTKFEAQADVFSHAKLWASVETYESKESHTVYFEPFRADYIAGVALYAGGFEVGVKHECDHGVEWSSSFIPWYWLDQTEVYVKISGRTR